MPSDEPSFPTARDPWTATILWARGQNLGKVSTVPNRTPVVDIISRLRAGESINEVAADFDVQLETVHVLWQLSEDIAQLDLEAAHG